MWLYPSDFTELRQKLLNLPMGTHVRMPRPIYRKLEPNLQKTDLGDLKGALVQYRDKYESKSVHVRVYEDFLEAHLDEKNPIYKPLEHLVVDATEVLLGVVTLGSIATVALFSWLKDR